MIKPVLLWTDMLIFVLVAVVIVFIFYARHHEHLRAPWRQVFRSRIGVASLLVLSVYVLIALLDSVHFRLPLATQSVGQQSQQNQQQEYYSVEVLSLLDIALLPLREQGEKTYSAPLATELFARETVELADGGRQRFYPRLEYGGAHLKNPAAERNTDLLKRSAVAIVMGLLIWLVLMTPLLWMLARRRELTLAAMLENILRRREAVPWFVVFMVSAMLLILIMLMVWLAPYYHLFGTDKVGQDVLYQALKSVRTALAIGTLTTLIMLPFAVLLGILAGYFRGWVDDVIQYLYTTLNSIPGVLLIAAAVLMLQVYIDTHPELFATDSERADMRLLFLCMILGITSWTGLCRLLRGETMKIREVEYIQAATAFGVRSSRIISRHILPNVMHIVLISVVLDFSGLVLAEAVLSYVGVGVDPSMHSWGNMINSARLEMAREPMVWWALVAAFVFMFVLVLAANLFSDVVRDAFDPRLRKG